ncbi:MAG: nucleoside triphosphate pyrophosphohydrolase [Chitinophagales bacterium]|nr:nucleoside triphosphate pyrophosphohydrolase [Chitinophagales bacterium]MDW8419180.1 nucleoside triphosphate pyrophosphohydrolase [Chitinophagales bacterium]
MNNRAEKLRAFERILTIMNELREQCPWDKKQTNETLRPLTIEETYELSDAILQQNPISIKEELGDLLLHIVFYARIGEEKGEFDIADIIDTLCEKLIARHPHIYGNLKVNDADEVKANWEKLKLKEGKNSVLAGVPAGLPALIKAVRIQDKAAQVKFEWNYPEEVWNKVEEELHEFRQAVLEKNEIHIQEEFGDLLFVLVNYARFLKIDPEAALEKANLKFIRRFKFIEERTSALHKSLHEMSLAEMDELWNKAKEAGL